MIESVELANFKSHERTTVRFAKGTNVIVGVMGSGKSSVMDAVCFALFGTFPALKSRRVALEDVISGFGEGKAKSASVTVKFDSDGKEYAVTRKIAEGGTEAFIRRNGELIEGPQPNRVTEVVEEVFGADYELFTRTAYCEQNKIDYFLSLGKGERKKQLDELLGLERIETARQSLSSVSNKLATEAAALKSALVAYGDTAAMEKELEAALEQIKSHLETSEGKKSETVALEKTLNAASAVLASAREMREKIQKAQMEIGAKNAELATLLRETALSKSAEELLSRKCAGMDKHAIAAELDTASKKTGVSETALINAASESSKAADAAKRLKSTKADFDATSSQAESLKKSLAVDSLSFARQKMEDATKKADVSRRKISVIEYEIASYKKSFESLRDAKAECPVCRTPLSAHSKETLIEESAAALQKARQNWETETNTLTRAMFDERSTRQAVEKLADLESKIAILQEGMAKAQASIKDEAALARELESAKAEMEKVRIAEQKLSAAKAAFENLERETSRLEKLEAQAQECRMQIEKMEQKIAALEKSAPNASSAGLPELEKTESAAREGLFAARTALDREKMALETLGKDRERLESALSKAIETDRKAGALTQKVEKAKTLQNALLSVQEELRTKLVAAVNETLAQVWKSVYPYHDYESASIAPSATDYELMLKASSGELVGIENASGGERSIAALALRMAFARVLAPKLGLLVLDEPTHNLDAAGTEALCEALGSNERASEFGQIIVITHDEKLKEAAGGALFLFERAKGGAGNDATSVAQVMEDYEMKKKENKIA